MEDNSKGKGAFGFTDDSASDTSVSAQSVLPDGHVTNQNVSTDDGDRRGGAAQSTPVDSPKPESPPARSDEGQPSPSPPSHQMETQRVTLNPSPSGDTGEMTSTNGTEIDIITPAPIPAAIQSVPINLSPDQSAVSIPASNQSMPTDSSPNSAAANTPAPNQSDTTRPAPVPAPSQSVSTDSSDISADSQSNVSGTSPNQSAASISTPSQLDVSVSSCNHPDAAQEKSGLSPSAASSERQTPSSHPPIKQPLKPIDQSAALKPKTNQSPPTKLLTDRLPAGSISLHPHDVERHHFTFDTTGTSSDTSRNRSESAPRPPSGGEFRKKRERNLSGNPPGVRGIIIESRRSRENSPNRSERSSPSWIDRSFILPAPGATRTRLPSSTSDNSIHSGGAGAMPTAAADSSETGTRPKTTRPSSDRRSERRNSSTPRRRYSGPSVTIPDGRQRLLAGHGDETGRSPQEVVEQSEEIMQNFMFERYNRDLNTAEGSQSMPRSPEILENFSRLPKTNVSAIGRRLATIGDEIDARYSREFAQMTKSLNITEGAKDEAYNAFRGVAMRLFQQGVMSMGKIVALLQFGYHLAIEVLRQGFGDFMSQIIKWLIRFISIEKIRTTISHTYQSIAEWIASRGGWQAASETLTDIGTTLADSAPYIAAFVAACASIAGIAYFIRNR